MPYLAAALIVIALTAPASADAAAFGIRSKATVVEVTDGDTIDVELRGRERAVRLIGIDTPEVYFGEECGGARASRSMERLLHPGDQVRLLRDRSQDTATPMTACSATSSTRGATWAGCSCGAAGLPSTFSRVGLGA